jgi:hypothetical protein
MNYATIIRESATRHYRSGQSDTSALDMLAVAGDIADAVEFFQSLSRGSKILNGTTAPDNGAGLDGDAYIDKAASDLYEKDGGEWVLMLSLRGKDGKTPVKGVDYFDGKTPQRGVDYFDGKTPVKGVDYQDGKTPVKGVDYQDGKDGSNGNRNRWEGFAPTAEPGTVGDAWYYILSASKLEIWECYQTAAAAAGGSQWRKRYTSPDAGSTSTNNPGTTTPNTGAGVSSFNSRTGAVSLTADDLLDKLEAGANTQLALNQATGKVRVTATATSNGSGITDTDGLPEGVGNLYFTGARVLATKLAGYAKSSAYAALGVGSTLLGWLQQIEYRLDSKQDKDTYAPLDYAANLTLDFGGESVSLLNLTGSFTLAGTINRGQGRSKRVFITNTTTAAVSLTFPAAWRFLGVVPTSLAAGKSAYLSLECVTGSSESDVVAGYNTQA